MRSLGVAAVCAVACAFVVTASRPAAADILVSISKTTQRMSVLVDGNAKYNWLVSTGSKRYTTPSGVYKPQWLAKKWRSRQYNNAPMPHSIFFYKGYAIHGTTEIKRLGKIASHGCVRLHPDNAAKLFSLVQKDMANTRVVVSNDIIEAPPGEAPKPKKKPNLYVAEAPVEAAPKLKMVALTPRDSGAKNPPAVERVYAKAPEVRPAKPARSEKVARAKKPGFHW